jgi:hypothetical protein
MKLGQFFFLLRLKHNLSELLFCAFMKLLVKIRKLKALMVFVCVISGFQKSVLFSNFVFMRTTWTQ